MLGAGVPAPLYNRYDQLENTKVKIARSILDELHALGPNGWAVQRQIVTELCGMQRPANGVEDTAAGRRALDALRRAAANEGVIVDTEQAARNDRATRAAKRQQHFTEQQQALDKLRTEFSTLASSKPKTNGERQARGYRLEKLLADLFRANELEYTGSTRQLREQVDGSFHFRGFTYLVEARWRNQPPDKEDLAGFKMKVDGKLESTRGLFISMAGFDEDVLQYFAKRQRKTQRHLHDRPRPRNRLRGNHRPRRRTPPQDRRRREGWPLPHQPARLSVAVPSRCGSSRSSFWDTPCRRKTRHRSRFTATVLGRRAHGPRRPVPRRRRVGAGERAVGALGDGHTVSEGVRLAAAPGCKQADHSSEH